jgi:hypothetical protein
MFIIFWNNNPQNLRAANRNRNTTENRNNNQDFRVARTFLARAVGVMVSAIGRSFALPIRHLGIQLPRGPFDSRWAD